MLLFLLLLFPLSLLVYYLNKKDPKQIIAIVTGILIGAVVSAFSFFFRFSHRIVPYSFILNFLYYIEKLGIITVVVIYGLFFLLSKDSYEDRITYFNPLMLSCYSILVPFYVITSVESSVYPGFLIFVKPIVYLSMIYATGFLLQLFYGFIVDKKIPMAVVSILAAVILVLVPSVIESMYAINMSFMLILLISVIYMLVPVVFFAVKKFLESKSDL